MSTRQEPIRVAEIIGRMAGGGVETVVTNYYRFIDKSKVQFDFFYFENSVDEPPADLIAMGARFYCLPSIKHVSAYCKKLRSIIRENGYSIVHAHLNTLSVIPLYCAWKEHVPIRIAHNHSVPAGKELRGVLKKFLRLFSKTFATDYAACSEAAGRWLFGNKTYDAGKVTVFANAIDYDRYKKDSEARGNIRSRYHIAPGTVVMGHVGRFTYAKNHEFLISIFNQYHKNHPESVLLLTGDGERRAEIENMIRSHHLDSCTIMTGEVHDVENYLNAMDVFVMPSRYEGLPTAAIEAQACQLPIVVSDVVPRAAAITNEIQFLPISAPVDQWNRAINISMHREIHFNSNKDNYDIHYACRILEEWYLNRLEEYSDGH